jgi:TPR repeat protein
MAAVFNVGVHYDKGRGVEQDYGKALEYYTLAAEKGVPVAFFAIGDFYYLGKGVEADTDKAAEYYQKALDAGYKPDEEDQEHLKAVMGEK